MSNLPTLYLFGLMWPTNKTKHVKHMGADIFRWTSPHEKTLTCITQKKCSIIVGFLSIPFYGAP